MSGNSTTYARDAGLADIAKVRHTDPMNTWPEHEQRHNRTIMGARLPDWECLRCHLESEAAKAAEVLVTPKHQPSEGDK